MQQNDSSDGGNERLRYGLSSKQGWHSIMEDEHAAYPDQDSSTSFFGVYDGHGGRTYRSDSRNLRNICSAIANTLHKSGNVLQCTWVTSISQGVGLKSLKD